MNIFQCLHNPARPTHLNLLYHFVLPKPKVHTLVACRKVTTRRRDCRKLCSSCGHHLHFSANTISIALVAHELQQNPMTLRGCFIMKHVCWPFIRIHNCVHAPVVVNTNEGPAYVLHNETATESHWILLKLVGHKSNRDGIGAEVKVVTAR